MIVFNAAAFIPVALVDADALAGYAGHPAIGEQIGRVGPDAVHAVGRDGLHKRESVVAVKRRRAVVGLPRHFAVCEGFADCHFALLVCRQFSRRFVV